MAATNAVNTKLLIPTGISDREYRQENHAV